jgi:lipopolysaccharide export system protein LptA
MTFRIAYVLTAFWLATGSAFAQSTEVAFGGLKHDSSLPIEATADKLEIKQSDGSALFTGNVVIGQGEMRITADRVWVIYSSGEDASPSEISSVVAEGNVTMVSGGEAAEADRAEYDIAAATMILTGNVILTQGQSAMSAEKMFIDLETGSATMDGRVRTILNSGANE